MYLVTDLNQVKKFWVLVYQILLPKYFGNLVKNLSLNGGKNVKLFSFYHLGNDEKKKQANQALRRKVNQSFYFQDLISNSPYCLPYNSHDVDSENLVLDQLIISKLIFFFILITCLLDIVLIV